MADDVPDQVSRSQLGTAVTAMLGGFGLVLLSVFAERLSLGSVNGIIGVWQAVGILAGGYAVAGGALLLARPRVRSFADHYATATWLAPRLLVIGTALVVIVLGWGGEPKCPAEYDDRGQRIHVSGGFDGEVLHCSYSTSSAL